MKCPFRMKALDHPDTCDPECALLIMNMRTLKKFCSLASIGNASVDTAIVNYVQHQEEKPVGALGRYSEKE